ncbi:MAG: hypothetical protein H0U16_04590 [Actinobacteria bacterium]|nr:hypothetical protein [Actinomycetota bacterium]
MQGLHAAGGFLLLGVTAAFTLAATFLALTYGAKPWLEVARRVLNGVLGAQVLVGAILYITGSRPGDGLHLLYAVAALGALPLGNAFSSEAPPKARAGVLAVSGLLALGLVFRLISTGD